MSSQLPTIAAGLLETTYQQSKVVSDKEDMGVAEKGKQHLPPTRGYREESEDDESGLGSERQLIHCWAPGEKYCVSDF
ncbi:hypothetical protein LTR56_023761 [Elasticomyces elasticus]|nr:hypothetical protein LTR56_023761 [Elasticomyces elasticus]KAK3662369.1 hypothetical protein LTR22_006902 [Elasticomyces elasticus]KAK4924693.1 hypothetical protein LTR49_008142 [Elasticomyces elasticus]KAK5766902.1 hypothetical protein LTS12_002978 [Elasticomyces elasticus]